MKCSVCGSPLARVGYRPKQYRNANGQVYKTINWPRYAPCRRLDDPHAHPARAAEQQALGSVFAPTSEGET